MARPWSCVPASLASRVAYTPHQYHVVGLALVRKPRPYKVLSLIVRDSDTAALMSQISHRHICPLQHPVISSATPKLLLQLHERC